jgi:flagellar biosynthetic protein FliQ
MTPQVVMSICQQAIYVMVMLVAPPMLTSLVVGLVISVLQAATQINEATLSFIPKLVAVLATLVVAGPWMISFYVDFLRRMYGSIPSVIG